MLKITPLQNINDTTQLRKLLQPVVDSVGNRSIIGLGEGTHGTREFTVIRSLLTQMLIEQKGFTTIGVETSYGDMRLLDRALNETDAPINTLMKQYLLAIYQTAEFKVLLEWVRSYNRSSRHKIQLTGIDYALIHNTALLVKQGLKDIADPQVLYATDSLVACAAIQDSLWKNLNSNNRNYDPKFVVINGINIYRHIRRIEKWAVAKNITLNSEVAESLLNLRQAVDPFYKPSLKETPITRDECMADMVHQLLQRQGTRMILWAHDAHIGQEAAFGEDNGGGMGGYIKKKHPDYFALATLTAQGTYSATKDRFCNNDNPFATYKLKPAQKSSWESLFSSQQAPAFYLNLQHLKEQPLKFRLIGYTAGSTTSADVYSDKQLSRLYDAIIFINETNAADHSIQ